jgi:competence protein ComEC
MVALAARMVARLRFAPGLPRAAAPAAALVRLLAEEIRDVAVWLPVAFGGGIALYLGLAAEPPWWAGAAVAVAGLLLTLALRRAVPLLAVGLLLLLAAALGFAVVQWHVGRAAPVEPLPSRAVVLEARIATIEALPQGRRVTLAEAMWDGRDAPLPRTLRVRLRDADGAVLRPGDRVRLRALLRPPSAPVEPGAHDFQRAAFFGGQAGVGFALGPVSVIAPAAGDPAARPATWFAALRTEIVARTRALLPGPEGAVAAALLTGHQAAIPRDAAQAMRDSGLSHLLSPSGLHVGIVMGSMFFVLRLLLAAWPYVALRLPIKEIALTVGLAAGGFYTALTGAEVPMLRTFLMAGLVVLALLAGRDAVSLRALALAAFVVLLLRPETVASASFQMSFAAVAALIAGFAALRGRLPAWLERAGPARRAAMLVAGLVATSMLAGMATMPFAAFHFQRLSLYGVVANALAVPLTSLFIMPAGMLAMLLMPLSLDWLALLPMGFGCRVVLLVAEWVAGWPGAAPAVAAMPGWGLACCVAGLLMLCLMRTRLRLAGAPLYLAGMLSPLAHVPPAVLVAADAQTIAINDGGVLRVLRAGSAGSGAFAVETWQRRAGGPPIAPLACGAPVCVIGDVAIVPRGPPPPGVCGRVPVVVSPEPLRRSCRGSLVIDRFDAWRDGSHAVWFTAAGPHLVSDRGGRGDRPWVPPRPRPAGAGPVAQRE